MQKLVQKYGINFSFTNLIFSGNSFQTTFNVNRTGNYLPRINIIREFFKTILIRERPLEER